jgi:hypothetical protein
MKGIGGLFLMCFGTLLLIMGLFSTYMLVLLSIREQVKELLWYLLLTLPIVFISLVCISEGWKIEKTN